MHKIPFMLLLFPMILWSNNLIAVKSTITQVPKKPDIPIHRPIVRPIVNTGPVYQDNYYNTTNEMNCDKYIEILAKKDEEILVLKQEIESLRNKEQRKLQKNLKKEYDEELKKFDDRQIGIDTKNKAVISDSLMK